MFLQLHDLHVAMGSPDTMPLLYAWHCIDGDGSQGLHQTPVHEPWRVKPTARVDTDGRTPMSRPTDDILSPDAAEQQVRCTRHLQSHICTSSSLLKGPGI